MPEDDNMDRIYGMHVMPRGEKLFHEVRYQCPCHPRLDVEPDQDGQYGFVVVHSSLNS